MTDTKRVPREPNGAMERAMELYDRQAPRIAGISTATVNGIWRAGWDAAPSEPDEARELLRETVEALENALTWADDSDDPDGEDAARHFRVIAKRVRDHLAAQDQPTVNRGTGEFRRAYDAEDRVTAQDQPQAESLTVPDESGTEHLTERGQNMMTRALMRSAKRATPAAEPDAERRIRELVALAANGWIDHPEDYLEDNIARALRTYGEECRAAEREKLRKWLDNNTTFYDVDADWPVEAPNVPTLAQVCNRIWYHATNDTESYPFSAVVDAAIREARHD